MKKIVWLLSMSLLFILLSACSDGTSNSNDTHDQDVYLSLREIEVVENQLVVNVNGEVNTSEDGFYYKVEVGNHTIMEEQFYVLEDANDEWVPFQLQVSLTEEDVQTEDTPYIMFYVKAGDDMINPNYVPIDIKDSK